MYTCLKIKNKSVVLMFFCVFDMCLERELHERLLHYYSELLNIDKMFHVLFLRSLDVFQKCAGEINDIYVVLCEKPCLCLKILM